MSILPHLLRSLILSGIFSFLLPLLLIGVILGSLTLINYVPWLEPVSHDGIEQVLNFLLIFGSGSAIRGIVIIGLVCSLVGILFDTYAFYRYQSLRDP